MYDSLSSARVRSVSALCKAFLYDFQKATAPTVFIQFQPTIRKVCNQKEVIRTILPFLAICQVLKIYGTFKISQFSDIAIIHLGGKGLADLQGHWASCLCHLSCYQNFALIIIYHKFSKLILHFDKIPTSLCTFLQGPCLSVLDSKVAITHVASAGLYQCASVSRYFISLIMIFSSI